MFFHKELKPYQFLVFKTAEKVAKNLALNVLKTSLGSFREKGRSIWALSDGRTVLKFYDGLNEIPDPGLDFWDHLMVFWVDERHVKLGNSISNFENTYRYFWNRVSGPKRSAKEYQQKLSTHRIAEGKDIALI